MAHMGSPPYVSPSMHIANESELVNTRSGPPNQANQRLDDSSQPHLIRAVHLSVTTLQVMHTIAEAGPAVAFGHYCFRSESHSVIPETLGSPSVA